MVDMGKIESEVRYERRKGYIQNAVLSAVAVTGLLLVSAAAPNALQLLAKFGGNKYKLKFQMKSVVTRLMYKGHIKFVERDGRKYIALTEAGQRALEMATREVELKVR